MDTTWTRQSGTAPQDPCGEEGCTSGTRNRYYTGKRLTRDAMQVEQDYLAERRHLLNRALHGWGVVYGYAVELKDGKLVVGAGLALDAVGRELVQTAGLELAACDLVELPPGPGDCWMLRVHYAERPQAPTTLRDPCDCERTQYDQVCETVRYSIQRIDCAECCPPQGCELSCGCAEGPCCGGGNWAGAVPRDGARCCICDHLTEFEPRFRVGKPATLADGATADLKNGVALACVTVEKVGGCEEWTITGVDACGPRKLVKRTDLLYDLIRGCDLTHVSDISWPAWHRSEERVAWSAFESFFATERSKEGGCVTDFAIEFSRPVRKSTVTPDCFSMTFLIRESEGGWELPMRAPIRRIEFGTVAGDPPDTIRRAQLVVGWAWASDAIHGAAVKFEKARASVEIAVIGDYILDCNGQAVDANPRGALPAPSGNGTPGGTFVSRFHLAKRPANPRDDDDDATIDNGDTQS